MDLFVPVSDFVRSFLNDPAAWLLRLDPTGSWWITYVTNLRLPALIIGGLLVVLTLIFVLLFLVRGLYFRLKLWLLMRRLGKKTSPTADLSKLFSIDRLLAHLWREYRLTLHEQKEVNHKTGSQELIGLRATVSAESFFNPQRLVDNRLRTEFFKHLPGICTGLGIIGTFFGLIQGLSAFTVSEDVTEVRMSLAALLHGVFDAFVVSAAAITIAMAITFLEKWLISSLYRATDALAQRLDGMFEAGASSEYLERLVKASEDSASQTKILKDALVADLKEILSDLSQQQIKAIYAGSSKIGADIVGGLERGFSEPLAKIAEAVKQVGNDQGQAVTTLLTDVLAGFSQRIQDLFSGQISGINDLQSKTIASLQTAITKLDQMVTGIDLAGRNATETMARTIGEAIEAIERRTTATNDRVEELISQMKNVTTDTIDKMGSGAGTLNAAVADFTKAAQGMTNVVSGVAQASDALGQSAKSITAATEALSNIVVDYRSTREVLDRMISELRSVVENAKTEASLTADILARIEGSATKLSQAQIQADSYLDKMSEVLAETHQEFSDNMRKTLGEGNRQFYEQLTQATQLLRAAIQELEVTLSTIGTGS
jgi:hypothetical protein